jgi:xanthosine utilization system XapX-like protein
VSFVFSFIAAVVGGWVCAHIARNSKAPKVLAAVVFILGLLVALSIVMASDDARPKVREGNVGNVAAMQNARQPAWVAFMKALIGPAGILIGARLKGAGVQAERR